MIRMTTTKTIAAASAVAFGGGMYSIYALFILAFLLHVDVSQLGVVQSVVAVTMFARFVVVMVAFAIKRTVPVALWLLFFADFFAAMVIVGANAFIRAPALTALTHSIDGAAITALLVGIPALLISFTAFEMARNQRIGRVLLFVLAEIGMLYFMAGYLQQAPNSIEFNDFIASMVVAAKDDIAAATIPQIVDPSAIFPLAAIYSSLLVYAGLPRVDQNVPTRARLALPLLATLVTLGGLFVASFYLRVGLVSFPARIGYAVVPFSLSLAAIWLLGRRASNRRPTVIARKVSPEAGR